MVATIGIADGKLTAQDILPLRERAPMCDTPLLASALAGKPFGYEESANSKLHSAYVLCIIQTTHEVSPYCFFTLSTPAFPDRLENFLSFPAKHM